jgi:glycosyltransferase involved in cell wall biosynthesis
MLSAYKNTLLWKVWSVKIVFLNDLHPYTHPGAASIAYSLAEEASNLHLVEFWCTNITGVPLPDNSKIKMKIRKISRGRAQKMEGGLLRRFYFELLGIREFVWVARQMIISRPTHIWFHQIGNRFPKILVPACRILGISTLTTLHDFGTLLGRKLYPSDFGWYDKDVSDHIKRIYLEEPRIIQGCKPQDLLLRMRKQIVKIYLNTSSSLICISKLQEAILSESGINVATVIPNGIDRCKCDLIPSLSQSKFNVLFAGRPNAKGLELLAQAVSEDENSHLHLAGSDRLVEIVDQYLDSNQYTFHGTLNSMEIYELIHKVELVSVISQCFDVYPTITLEAIAHGCPVLTTPLTGNSDLANAISPELVLDFAMKPNLSRIKLIVKESPTVYPSIYTVSDTWKRYEEILIQIS